MCATVTGQGRQRTICLPRPTTSRNGAPGQGVRPDFQGRMLPGAHPGAASRARRSTASTWLSLAPLIGHATHPSPRAGFGSGMGRRSARGNERSSLTTRRSKRGHEYRAPAWAYSRSDISRPLLYPHRSRADSNAPRADRRLPARLMTSRCTTHGGTSSRPMSYTPGIFTFNAWSIHLTTALGGTPMLRRKPGSLSTPSRTGRVGAGQTPPSAEPGTGRLPHRSSRSSLGPERRHRGERPHSAVTPRGDHRWRGPSHGSDRPRARLAPTRSSTRTRDGAPETPTILARTAPSPGRSDR